MTPHELLLQSSTELPGYPRRLPSDPLPRLSAMWSVYCRGCTQQENYTLTGLPRMCKLRPRGNGRKVIYMNIYALSPQVQVEHLFIVRKMLQRSVPSTRQNEASQFFALNKWTASGSKEHMTEVDWGGNSEICWGPAVTWEWSQGLCWNLESCFQLLHIETFPYLIKPFDHFISKQVWCSLGKSCWGSCYSRQETHLNKTLSFVTVSILCFKPYDKDVR